MRTTKPLRTITIKGVRYHIERHPRGGLFVYGGKVRWCAPGWLADGVTLASPREVLRDAVAVAIAEQVARDRSASEALRRTLREQSQASH